ncbi:MAG: hypothetical protein EP329_27255, partial [Deltaproteobacteria bacterium]
MPRRSAMTRRHTCALLLAGVLTASLFPAQALAASGDGTFAPPKKYLLALGDSGTFGTQYDKMLISPLAENFNSGYVDRFVERLRGTAVGADTQVVNYACPGESTASMLAGPCAYSAVDGYPLHDAYEGSQLDAALAFLAAHPGEVSPILITIGANDLQQFLFDHCHLNPLCVFDNTYPWVADTAANLDRILGKLRSAAPNTEILIGLTYNPYVAVLPPSDPIALKLNEVLAIAAAKYDVRTVDGFAALNASGPQPETICKYTGICGPLFDIHPSDLGYRLLGDATWDASGYGVFETPGPAAASERGLPNGVAAGDVTQTTAVLWARADEPGTVRFQLATAPFGANASGGRTLTVSVADPSVPAKLKLTGLEPGTQYYYRARSATSQWVSGRFRTPAVSGTHAGVRIGVSGDSRGELAPFPSVKNVPERDLDVFVHLGDSVYADYPSPNVPLAQCVDAADFRAKHDEVYSERDGLNTLAALRASTALLATVDDHEVTNDYAGGATPPSGWPGGADGASYVNETPLFDAGLSAFTAFQPIDDERYGDTGDPRTAHKRKLYRERRYGDDAALFVLDARSFRDAAVPELTDFGIFRLLAYMQAIYAPGRTMLGAQQLADLKAGLVAAQQDGVTWKLVFLPEPIQQLGAVLASDRYEGYAAERAELLSFIRNNAIQNVAFVTADMHGTLVDDLAIQTSPFGSRTPVAAFEIITGPIAFDPPMGTSLPRYLAHLGLVDPGEVAAYEDLPMSVKDEVFEGLVNSLLSAFGLGTTGLQGTLIDATLITGRYTRANAFGWTELDVDAASQALTVTTYGIHPYGPDDLDDAEAVTARVPFVLQRFVVRPSSCGNGTCDPGDAGHCPEECAVCGNGVCDPFDEQLCPEECAVCGNGVCDPFDELMCPEECDPCTMMDGFCDPWCGFDRDPDCAECVGGDGHCAPGCELADPDCGPIACRPDGFCEAWCGDQDPDCAECIPGDGHCFPGCEPLDPDCEPQPCGPDGYCDQGCGDADPDCAQCVPGDGQCFPGCEFSDPDCGFCREDGFCEAPCGTTDPDCERCVPGDGACFPGCEPLDPDCEPQPCRADGFCESWCGDADPDCAQCVSGDGECRPGCEYLDADCGACRPDGFCEAPCGDNDPDCAACIPGDGACYPGCEPLDPDCRTEPCAPNGYCEPGCGGLDPDCAMCVTGDGACYPGCELLDADCGFCQPDGFCEAECGEVDPDCTQCVPGDGQCFPGCEPLDPDCQPQPCAGDGFCDARCGASDPDCALCIAGDGACFPGCELSDPDCGLCVGDEYCEAMCGDADPDCGQCVPGDGACFPGCEPLDPDCGMCAPDGYCDPNCGDADPDCGGLCSADGFCDQGCGPLDPDCGACVGGDRYCYPGCHGVDPDCGDPCRPDGYCEPGCGAADPDCAACPQDGFCDQICGAEDPDCAECRPDDGQCFPGCEGLDPDCDRCLGDGFCDPACGPADPDCGGVCAGDGLCDPACGPLDPDCVSCMADGVCDPACGPADPDCEGACLPDGVCDPACGSLDPDCVACLGGDGFCELSCGDADPDCARCVPGDNRCFPGCEPVDPDCAQQPCTADGVCDLACAFDPDCGICAPDGYCDAACGLEDPDCAACVPGDGACYPGCEPFDPDCAPGPCMADGFCEAAACGLADPDCVECIDGDGLCLPGCEPLDGDCAPLCAPDGLCDPACSASDPDCGTCPSDGYCEQTCGAADPDCADCAPDGFCFPGCGDLDPDCVPVDCPADGLCDPACGAQDPDCGCPTDGFCDQACGSEDPDCAWCSFGDGVCFPGCEGLDADCSPPLCPFDGFCDPMCGPADPDCAECVPGDALCVAGCELLDPDCAPQECQADGVCDPACGPL